MIDMFCHWRYVIDNLFGPVVRLSAGSAVAGLRECYVQPDASTPKPVWNPDIESPIDYGAGWTLMPTRDVHDNAFKAQWELFLRYVARADRFPGT